MVTLGFIETSNDNQNPRINSVKKKMLVARSKISEKLVLTSFSSAGAGLFIDRWQHGTARAAVAAKGFDRPRALLVAWFGALRRAARNMIAVGINVSLCCGSFPCLASAPPPALYPPWQTHERSLQTKRCVTAPV